MSTFPLGVWFSLGDDQVLSWVGYFGEAPKMFKTAHAVLDGRSIAFHQFLQELSLYWPADKNWLKLKAWFTENTKPLRNNSSWIIPGKTATHL
jgi:hypothetical protein